ncbi:MAG: hypothetical protein ACRDOT_03740 [Aeromicrobium sp.]
MRTAAFTLVGLQIILRAWSIHGGWFYSDDFLLLEKTEDEPFGLDVLMRPHDSQLMPFGIALVWLVSHAGPFAWTLTATLTLAIQVVASVSCYLMLRTVFGERWGILAPLALYLFAAMSPDVVMWWAASLNGLPIQAAFFLLVSAVVVWARQRRVRAVVWAALALALAAASGPRGLVMVVPIGVFMALFLSPGDRWFTKPWTVARLHWPFVVPLATVAAGYLTVYAMTTPSPVAAVGDAPALQIGRQLVGTAWLPPLVGGPWQWQLVADPVSVAAPPRVAHIVAAVVVVATVSVMVRRNPRPALAALAMLATQLLVTYLAIVFGRGLQVGELAALVTRYLADTLPVTALALGLATMPVLAAGAPAFSRELPAPGALSRPGRFLMAGAAAVMLTGAVASTLAYVAPWHREFPAREFVANARTTIAADPAPVADVEVPELVQLPIHYPHNLPSHLLAPYGDLVQTSKSGNDLRILDDRGRSSQASISGGSVVEPGDEEGCGLRIGSRPQQIELAREDMDEFPWTSLNYAASAGGQGQIRFDGRRAYEIDIAAGPHTYFLVGDGAYSTVEIRTTTPRLQMCLDMVRAGPIAALP